jgi:folate-binding protein YgfZ
VTSPKSELWLAPEPVDIVWFSGADAERFLNDLISQEISDLEPGDSRRSFLLGPQGKLDFMFWVVRDLDRIGLIIEGGRGEELAAALSRYRIRVDVEIEIESDRVWLVLGEADGWDVSWDGQRRTVVVGEQPGLEICAPSQYERRRIEAGEPRWGVDVDESTIPHESGLVPSSVDFTKGCFLGQELVARIDSRGGNVPRHLRRVEIEGSLPPLPVALVKEDKEVGVVTSAVGGIGLAMVRRGVETGETVTIGEARVIVGDHPNRSVSEEGAESGRNRRRNAQKSQG